MELVAPETQGEGERQRQKQRRQRRCERERKGHVNEMLNFWADFWDNYKTRGAVLLLHFNEHWDPDSDLNSLLPICPLSSPSTKIAEPDSWAQVESAREQNRFSFKDQPIHRIQVCSVGRRHGQVVPSFQCRAGRVLDHESRGCAESRHKEGEGEHSRIFGGRWEKRLSTEQFPKAIGWNDEFARYLDHTCRLTSLTMHLLSNEADTAIR